MAWDDSVGAYDDDDVSTAEVVEVPASVEALLPVDEPLSSAVVLDFELLSSPVVLRLSVLLVPFWLFPLRA